MLNLFRSKADQATTASKPGIFAALDIGASKVVCFIAKVEQTLTGPRPRIIGVGHQSSRGIRSGAVVDMEAAEKSIRAAVQQAERMAGHAVTAVTLVTAAGGPSSTRLSVEANLSNREVTDRDLRRALDAGLGEFHTPDRVMLHAIPLSWRVDDHRGVKDPRGMFGRSLGVELHFVSANIDPLRNLATCVERCQLSIVGMVAAPYASGLSTLTDDERELGALVIDMGATMTTAAVFAEGSLLHVDGAPVGGAHVTSDIARGLSTPMSAAERIKALYGSALDSPDDDQVMIEIPPMGNDPQSMMGSAPRAMLNAIIRPRLEEIFELMRDRLAAAGVDKASGRTLVLTGGAAQLPGTAQLAGRVLGKQVRLGRPQHVNGLGDAVSGPGFSACAGVVVRRTRGAAEAIAGPPRINASGGSGRANVKKKQRGDKSQRSMLSWFAESF
ncbi:cell division protein FtsA [Woodsholea maritima]|uniref:cell division protein FtsA n=1 Tax=Woodsholea maritima TaxID=240237 RepID=UPI000368C621|nr:cell division protein FtsA [Woodsholea maritima]